MAMTTTSKGKLLATVFALVAIGLIVVSLVRGHPIDKRDLGDLYGCYVVDGQQLFRLTPEALVTPSRAVPFAARQGRRHAYLDLASPMRVVHRGGALSFEPGPEPAVNSQYVSRNRGSISVAGGQGRKSSERFFNFALGLL